MKRVFQTGNSYIETEKGKHFVCLRNPNKTNVSKEESSSEIKLKKLDDIESFRPW